VSGTGATAGPVLQFMELDLEEVRYPLDRLLILPGRSVKGASRIVG
jgi:hypothetical protein